MHVKILISENSKAIGRLPATKPLVSIKITGKQPFSTFVAV